MKLELGVPNAGTKVVIDLSEGGDLESLVTDGLEALKAAGDVWRAWSLEHETDEEKATRLAMEKNRMLQRQMVERQNIEIEELLEGTTEGIGKIGRGGM
jgi:DNA-binding transcriptional MerR regulator